MFTFSSPLLCGNSNTGPQIKRILDNISVSAEILEIAPETLYRLGKCCNMINSTKLVNPSVYDRYARAAFASLTCDLGNFGNLTANMHSLLCHGSQYIRYVQDELGVPLGQLTENSLELGNKINNQYRKIFSRRGNVKQENCDIFKRRLLISDAYLVIEGVLQQKLRRGNVKAYIKSVIK